MWMYMRGCVRGFFGVRVRLVRAGWEDIAFWDAPSSFGACVWIGGSVSAGCFRLFGGRGREYPGGVRDLPSLPEGSDPLLFFFWFGGRWKRNFSIHTVSN